MEEHSIGQVREPSRMFNRIRPVKVRRWQTCGLDFVPAGDEGEGGQTTEGSSEHTEIMAETVPEVLQA